MSVRERHIPYELTHMQNSRYKTRKKETNQKTVKYRELVVGGWRLVRRCMKQMKGFKECTCDKLWVMYGIVESYSTSETNIPLYVNYTAIKIKTNKLIK